MTRVLELRLRVHDNRRLCHCEEGTEVTDAAIHRVSGDANDLSLRLLVHSGSPRAYALAMTRVLELRLRVHDNRQTLSLRGRNASD